jgi:hypothetical protein
MATEAHDTHHPIASAMYYEDQMSEALRYAKDICEARMPKFLQWFERTVVRNPAGSRYLVGGKLSYADLSLFQLIARCARCFRTRRGARAGQDPCGRRTARLRCRAAAPGRVPGAAAHSAQLAGDLPAGAYTLGVLIGYLCSLPCGEQLNAGGCTGGRRSRSPRLKLRISSRSSEGRTSRHNSKRNAMAERR